MWHIHVHAYIYWITLLGTMDTSIGSHGVCSSGFCCIHAICLPFAEGCRYKNEGTQEAYLVQTWHRVPPVAHGTDLQIWDPSQTYHPSTKEIISKKYN